MGMLTNRCLSNRLKHSEFYSWDEEKLHDNYYKFRSLEWCDL